MFVHGEVCEQPEGVGFGVALEQQIPDYEVDALRVAHGGEMVCDTFEHFFEKHHSVLFELEGAIEVLFDLGKAIVMLGDALQLVVGGIGINLLLLLIRWLVMFVSHLKSQTTSVGVILLLQPIQYRLPLLQNGPRRTVLV